MEEKRGIFTYLGGIIRIVIFLVIIALLAFFVIRFVRNRQADKRAQQATKTSQQQQEDNNKDSNDNKNKADNNQSSSSNKDNNASKDNNQKISQIPSGIDDESPSKNSQPSPPNTNIPNTGFSQDVVATALLLGVIVYLLVKNVSYKHRISLR